MFNFSSQTIMDKIYWNWLLFYNISNFFQTIHPSAPPLPSTMLFTVCDCPQHCIGGGGGMFYDRTSTVPNILSMIVGKRETCLLYIGCIVMFFIFRLSLWTRKTDCAKLTAKPPQLRSLPPTDPALELNIKRTHYKTMMWHKCVDGRLPSKDPCEVLPDY